MIFLTLPLRFLAHSCSPMRYCYSRRTRSGFTKGRVQYLTSHCACYVDNEDPRKFSVAVELKNADLIEYYIGFLKSSPEIMLLIKPSTTTSATANNFTSSPGNRSAASTGAWICPILSFSNPILLNYIPQATPIGSIPPCLACGIRASPGVLESSPQLLPRRSPTPLSLLSLLYSTGSKPTPSPATTAASTNNSSEATFACPKYTFLNYPSLCPGEICGERLLCPDLTPDQLLEIRRGESPALTSISRKGGLISENGEVVKISFRPFGEKGKWLVQNPLPVPTAGQSGNGGASRGGGFRLNPC
ncbi:hypothetical protein B9Z19DRAFT_1099673 [Tuber borchii]|uniref:Uncharacterized protein n=1 Tax=Tuber borchii TaxID=42251 RepID=A0A2T7A1I2_TUBBO|nr:hypothetical protein B9Z19DRAFT_1099673 [Tuber borchii]